jgi:hypothetical protein
MPMNWNWKETTPNRQKRVDIERLSRDFGAGGSQLYNLSSFFEETVQPLW